jgi:O-antigen ligase
MLAANPLGVGSGNFYQNIGNYTEGGAYASMDAHNTYLRCACELGIQGIAVFLALIGGAAFASRKAANAAARLPEDQRVSIQWLSYGLLVSLTTLLGCCLTISLLYVEYVWWFLLLPVCVHRAAWSLEAQEAEQSGTPAEWEGDGLNESWFAEEPYSL